MQNLEADLQQLLNGTENELAATLTVHVDGRELTQPEVVAKLRGFLEAYAHVAATKAAYAIALQARQEVASEAQAFKLAYGQVVRHVLGKASPSLGSFGITVTQRKTPTVETQLLAQAKRLATRKARGTLGRRQKQRIKGADIAAVTVTADGSAGSAVTDDSPVLAPVITKAVTETSGRRVRVASADRPA